MNKNTALITGSSNGFGRVLANYFAEKGYDLILHGRKLDGLKTTRDEVQKWGNDVTYVQGDLKERKTIEDLAQAAIEKDISLLINNAAESRTYFPFIEADDDYVEEMIYTNLTAPILLTRRIFSHFTQRGGGDVVNINSIFSVETRKKSLVYTASKYGLRGFAKTLRLEADEKNIGVMEVFPTKILLPGGNYGMDSMKVAEIVYNHLHDSGCDELFIEGRPRYPERETNEEKVTTLKEKQMKR